MKRRAAWALFCLLLPLRGWAEPYLAVESGFRCVTCHTNPSGGGKRNVFGTGYAQSELARRVIALDDSPEIWTGEINRWISIGGNLRGGFEYTDTPGLEEESEFGVERATLYTEFKAIPGLLSVYLDEQVAPGGAINREAYGLLTPAGGQYTIKVGKFFLPYGLRLQDDTAFVRQATGINFNTPDNGVEFGLELDRWSAQIALSNGTAGASDIDSTKQTSVMASYVRALWRIGASYNFNNADLGDREMRSLFAGLRTGPVSWLAEIDYIEDDIAPSVKRDLYVTLLEGNWRIGKGNNIKLSYEFFDPDDAVDEDDQERYSLVWEFSPAQMIQTRIGVRKYNGVPQRPVQNLERFFAQLHLYF